MKKRKFSFWLSMGALCLCLATLAFGVYSAKQARLTTNGTVSFKAHDCKVAVVGTISNAMRSESLNYAQVSDKTYTDDGSGNNVDWADSFTTGDNYLTSADTWTFGDIYFDDMNIDNTGSIQPIVIILKLSNYSNFPVKASFSLPTITGVETTGSVNEVFMDAKKTTDTDPTTGELKLTLTLGADVTEVASQDLNLDVNINKITSEEYEDSVAIVYTLEEGETTLPDLSATDYTFLNLPSTLTTVNASYIPTSVTKINVTEGDNNTFKANGDVLYKTSDGSAIWIANKKKITLPKELVSASYWDSNSRKNVSLIKSSVNTILIEEGNTHFATTSSGTCLWDVTETSMTLGWVSSTCTGVVVNSTKSIYIRVTVNLNIIFDSDASLSDSAYNTAFCDSYYMNYADVCVFNVSNTSLKNSINVLKNGGQQNINKMISKIYVKSGITDMDEKLSENYTKTDTSDLEGYVKWTFNG